jgi:hypothetical protein
MHAEMLRRMEMKARETKRATDIAANPVGAGDHKPPSSYYTGGQVEMLTTHDVSRELIS